ncbi:MAG: type II toxin-antitoxin system ParD family antitoxin [Chloroflexota bacterium]|nr:type II toxin-antitoxin system ParD family antitoxin [Chloroflexota bacterium]
MNITLTPQLEAMIQEKVERGLYDNHSEVVRDALRLMQQQDKLERLRAAIAIGIEAADRGEGRPYTPELLAEINREADRMIREGEPLDPDVCP